MSEERKAQVIAFVSGKGGSGKTSACLSMARLLAEAEYKVLVLDFDLATNGASYFFREQMERSNVTGIWEALLQLNRVRVSPDHTAGFELKNLVMDVTEGFAFVPSRVVFEKKLIESEAEDIPFAVQSSLLSELVKDREWQGMYDYILIDCQAGYAHQTSIALENAHKAVIVTELDRISNDAAENLLIQVGEKFPRYRRYLMNKVTKDEVRQYEDSRDWFYVTNRLPPLPHDFEVRRAFGERRIPIDLSRPPTTYLFSVLDALEELLGEEAELLKALELRRIRPMADAYNADLEKLIDERNELAHDLDPIEEDARFRRRSYFSALFAGATYAAIGLSVMMFLVSDALASIIGGLAFAAIGIFAAASTGLLYVRGRLRLSTDERRKMQNRLDYLQQHLAQFESMAYSRSRDFDSRFRRQTEEPFSPGEASTR